MSREDLVAQAGVWVRRAAGWTHRASPRVRLWVRRAAGWTRRALRAVTGLGWACCGLGLLSAALGWGLGWQELQAMAVTCGCVLLLAVPYTAGRAAVEVAVDLPAHRLTAGTPAQCTLTARNIAGRRLGRLLVEAPVRMTRDRGDQAPAAVDCAGLSAGDARTGAPARIPTDRRGVVLVGPAVWIRSDPLGLLRRTLTLTGVTEILVHPKTTRIAPTGAGLLRDLEGQTSNDLSMNDVAFHALREYTPGDDLRHVHALTSARVGRLMVRQFVDTRTAHLAVAVSGAISEYHDADEFETALSVGGSIALRAVDDAQRVSVLAAGHVTSSTAARARRVVLDGLSRAEFGATGTGLCALATRVTRIAPDTSLAVLITGGLTSIADLRPAAARFGPDVRVVAIRIDAGAPPSVRRVGQFSVLTLSALPALRTALRAGM